MKKTLLYTTLLFAIGATAQTVNNFYPLNANPTAYSLADSDPAIDETTTGANATWNFTNLDDYGTSSTTVITPTAGELSTYPGTTAVVLTGSGSGTASQFFLAHALNGGVSVTGVSYAGITLNYSTNNFNLGTFPKAFTDNAVQDDVAGTFTYGNFNGTFTGNGSTVVDGYGTLNVNIGSDGEEETITVTRLKITQTLNLTISGLPIGTLTQTMYNYYAASPVNAPAFRTITATVNLPAFGGEQTEQSIESYLNPTAGIDMPGVLGDLRIAPNPVNNILHLGGANEIKNIVITDAAGRVVAQYKANDANVSHLSAGIYVVSAATEKGTQTLKMVKQ